MKILKKSRRLALPVRSSFFPPDTYPSPSATTQNDYTCLSSDPPDGMALLNLCKNRSTPVFCNFSVTEAVFIGARLPPAADRTCPHALSFAPLSGNNFSLQSMNIAPMENTIRSQRGRYTRLYLTHFDFTGVIQFVTIREDLPIPPHVLNLTDSRTRQIAIERYFDSRRDGVLSRPDAAQTVSEVIHLWRGTLPQPL